MVEVVEMSDPGGEQIILDRLKPAFYCFSCQKEMKAIKENSYECPVCKHVYTSLAY